MISRKIRAGLGALICLAVAAPALANSEKSTVEDQKSISITIYNDNLGLVKEVRELRLPRGTVDLRFEGVAAQIDPTSVHIRSLNNPNHLAILEQNFEYDLISPQKLMEKFLGQDVELITRVDGEDVVTSAKLIGNQGGYVYQIDGKIAVNPHGRVVLPELPEGLISRPTLMWMLANDRSGHEVEASYLTGGIGWRANYVTVLSEDDKSVDLSGWVTITNSSGATYKDASLKLVAGDVHRAPVARGGRRMEMLASSAMPVEEQFAEQQFFDYHLYTLQRPSTIKDNQTKQISLLDAEDVGVKKVYVYQPAGQYWYSRMPGPDKSKVSVLLEVENAKENNLGMPLPKGVVRVYKKDPDGALQFVGEDRIDHTPRDETIRVKVGNAFDIVAERIQTNYRVLESSRRYESSYKISIRNHKDEDVTVSVIESIPSDWEILEKSHEYVKETSNRIRFDVPVESDGETEVTYTVRVKY